MISTIHIKYLKFAYSYMAANNYFHFKIIILWRQIEIKRSPDEQLFKSVWEQVHLNIVITKQGVYFFARVKTGRSGTRSLVE